MREFFHRLLQRLHDEARPLSRNKHFHALSDGDGRRALRADRHLRDLEEHLEALRQQGQRPRVRRLPDGVVGLAFFGFPLHPTKKPSRERAAHLANVAIPMLFLQGTHDALAKVSELEPV